MHNTNTNNGSQKPNTNGGNKVNTGGKPAFKSRFGAPTSGDTFTRKTSDDDIRRFMAGGDDDE